MQPEVTFRDRALAALMLTLPLGLLAEVLVLRTHHRPLGAATLASVAVIAFVLGSLLVFRVRTRWASGSVRSAGLLWALGVASLAGTLVRAYL